MAICYVFFLQMTDRFVAIEEEVLKMYLIINQVSSFLGMMSQIKLLYRH